MSAVVWVPLAVAAGLASSALTHWVIRRLHARARRRRIEKLTYQAFPRHPRK